jgi:tetratricopeptide (TPR) repeat protein
MRLVYAMVIVLMMTATVFADSASEAKAYYERATADFAIGDFAKAADEYQEAYRLKPDAALLYNAAQAYRLAGNNEKALILYKNYVNLYPNQPNVEQVRSQIEKLKEAVAAQEQAKTNPPTSTVPVQPAVVPPPQQAQGEAQPQAQLTATAERPRPLTKKPWFWATLGASVLVVAGVTVGVVLGTQPHAPTPTVGRVDGN